MSMKWIGKGVLKVGEKLIGYGENIPKNAFTRERLKKFKNRGAIGAMIEKVEPEPEPKEPDKKTEK